MLKYLYFEDNTIEALVWTIIHSLWQFTLIATVMSVLLKLYQSEKSEKRYYMVLGSLVLSLVTSTATFLYYYLQNENESTTWVWSGPIFSFTSLEQNENFLSQFYGLIDAYRMPIFVLWLSGVLLFILKFIFSMAYVEFLSRTSFPVSCRNTFFAFERVYQHFNIKNKIQIGESKYIKSPMILGVLKPVILFPIGVINHLDIIETEAIIAHELAHFVRKDIYINMLQTLIEVFFYYHPAIWWISANIKIERENCCDDLAISYTGNRIQYAKTLVKMLEYYQISDNPSLAMSFSNKNSFFSNRIKRILNMTQTRNYLKEKTITLFILIAIIALFAKDLTGSSSVSAKNDIKQEITVSLSDTMPNIKESVRIQKKTNEKDIKISIEDGKITELEVDGKKIDKSDYDKYDDIIAEVKPKTTDRGNARMFIFGDKEGQPFEFRFGNENSIDSMFNGLNLKGLGNLHDLKGLEGFENLDMQQGQLHEQLKKLQEQLGKMNFDFKYLDSLKFNFDDFAFPEFKEWPGQMESRPFDFEHNFPDNFEENGIEINKNIRPNNFSEIIGNALNKDGLLLPGQENKVELSGKNLKINGEKQPNNIFQKYKRIFEEESGTTLKKNSKLEFNFMGVTSKRKFRVY